MTDTKSFEEALDKALADVQAALEEAILEDDEQYAMETRRIVVLKLAIAAGAPYDKLVAAAKSYYDYIVDGNTNG